MSKKLPLNILIIDDNQDDLDFYTRLLKQSDRDYKIFTASNAKKGLEIFETEKIDCTFMDYYLPSTNGLEIMDKLKKISKRVKIPLLIITGDPSQKVQADAARKGALNYIVKEMTTTTDQLDDIIEQTIAWAK